VGFLEDYYDIFIDAGGILNGPATPCLKDYKGTLVRTANYDGSIDLRGKHVGLLGNGSSGIQAPTT
jgi:cation diffusion facilitator CzcD-associated flavoprotein CzcO